jgi:hypothetical protein
MVLLALLGALALGLWQGEVRGDLRLRELIADLRIPSGPYIQETPSGDAPSLSQEPQSTSLLQGEQATRGPGPGEASPNVKIDTLDGNGVDQTAGGSAGERLAQSIEETPHAPLPATIELTGIWHPAMLLSIDGGPSRRIALLGSPSLAAGEHVLMFSLRSPLYRATRTMTIHLEPGTERTVICPLKPPGAITIQAALGASRGLVRVDGEIVGKTPVRQLRLAPGEHQVSILFARPSPARTMAATASLGSGEETIVTFDPRSESGFEIRSKPLEPAVGSPGT